MLSRQSETSIMEWSQVDVRGGNTVTEVNLLADVVAKQQVKQRVFVGSWFFYVLM